MVREINKIQSDQAQLPYVTALLFHWHAFKVENINGVHASPRDELGILATIPGRSASYIT